MQNASTIFLAHQQEESFILGLSGTFSNAPVYSSSERHINRTVLMTTSKKFIYFELCLFAQKLFQGLINLV